MFLSDSFNRRFEYLRLSVTDVCNFKCQYCLPDGYQKSACAKDPLTPDEIENLVTAFAELGFWKVRLTGGEPTVRNDLSEIAARISRIPGIKKIALTTNGYSLAQKFLELRAAGISALNVSIDSLDRERFKIITGVDRLGDVLKGIDRALGAGFDSIKINAVYLKDLNDCDLESFENWVATRPISVRFIELMRTGQNEDYFKAHYLSGEALKKQLREKGWSEAARKSGDGPAVEFTRPGSIGRIGVISPYSEDFCATCNRLRVSSEGQFRLCLFGETSFDLRPLLKSPSQKLELIETFQRLIQKKPVSHYLKEGNYGQTQNFSEIGG